MKVNEVTRAVIGSAIEVHRALGPGLLESAYEECLCHELTIEEIPFERQRHLPVEYKGIRLDCGYRLDLLVAELVVVEVKALDSLLPIYEAQLLTYLKLGGCTTATPGGSGTSRSTMMADAPARAASPTCA